MGRSGRRRWCAVVLAGLLGVSGCGERELLDPGHGELAADRARLVEHMTVGLQTMGDQLGAGPALATRVDTSCHRGEDTWKYQDTYRSTCHVTMTSGFALDVGLDGALGDGLDGLLAFEDRADAAGWMTIGWWTAGSGPMSEQSVEDLREDGLTATDVTGVRMLSTRGDGTMLDVGFLPGSEPVDAGEVPIGGYYGDREGGDWRTAWNSRRQDHVLLVTVGAYAVLAEQPW